jgi:peptidoglycan/LPS O-acetylase OafA/YrhL
MRIKRLDILRCVAVLLVVTAHSGIFLLTDKVGWVGVGLFFVLSGFLISGLLYSESRLSKLGFRLWKEKRPSIC